MPNTEDSDTARKRRLAEFHAREIGRAEVERELRAAADGGRVPCLTFMRMAGGKFAGIDFTSKLLNESDFGAEILAADFRNADLYCCNFSRCDLTSSNLRGADL